MCVSSIATHSTRPRPLRPTRGKIAGASGFMATRTASRETASSMRRPDSVTCRWAPRCRAWKPATPALAGALPPRRPCRRTRSLRRRTSPPPHRRRPRHPPDSPSATRCAPPVRTARTCAPNAGYRAVKVATERRQGRLSAVRTSRSRTKPAATNAIESIARVFPHASMKRHRRLRVLRRPHGTRKAPAASPRTHRARECFRRRTMPAGPWRGRAVRTRRRSG